MKPGRIAAVPAMLAPWAAFGAEPATGAASRGSPPKNFHPQLATLANRVPEGDNWLHELKFDGYRIIARFEKGKVQLFSRNGNDFLLQQSLDGLTWAQMRITHLHLGPPQLEVGPYACSPTGQDFRCQFSWVEISPNVWRV